MQVKACLLTKPNKQIFIIQAVLLLSSIVVALLWIILFLLYSWNFHDLSYHFRWSNIFHYFLQRPVLLPGLG